MKAVEDAIDFLKRHLDVDKIRVEEARIGVFYSGVKLNTGHGGVAFTPIYDISEAVCCPKSYGRMPEAGRLRDIPLVDMATNASSRNPLEATLGVAALNAASAAIVFDKSSSHPPRIDVDALDMVDIHKEDRVAMVGAFTPYIKKLQGKVASLDVLERNPKAAAEVVATLGERKKTSMELLEEADILITTGSSIVNQTIDELLLHSKNARERIMVGPTASIVPQPFFQRGITVMGGIQVFNADVMLNVVSQAGGGYALLKHCSKKFAIANPEPRGVGTRAT